MWHLELPGNLGRSRVPRASASAFRFQSRRSCTRLWGIDGPAGQNRSRTQIPSKIGNLYSPQSTLPRTMWLCILPVCVLSGLSGKEGRLHDPGLCLTEGPEVETAS